ncbi:MAG: xanthine dehydrogenase family protein subunit M [Myxococcota bacterium]
MKPAPFEYEAPSSVEEALRLLADPAIETSLLADGQSLVPALNMRLARPERLVDLGRIEGLDAIRDENGALCIGAMATKRSIERSALVAQKQPLLHEATGHIAHPQIRNRGTLGGSMAHADPAAEYPAVAVALDAEFRVIGPSGERRIAAADFFVTYLTTALAEDEILLEVTFPERPAGEGVGFAEICRRHGDFAMAGAAATARLEAGRYQDARIVLFGVDATPVRALSQEERLRGEVPSEALHAEVAAAIGAGLEEPPGDQHASPEFRRQLARTVSKRALEAAVARAAKA